MTPDSTRTREVLPEDYDGTCPECGGELVHEKDLHDKEHLVARYGCKENPAHVVREVYNLGTIEVDI